MIAIWGGINYNSRFRDVTYSAWPEVGVCQCAASAKSHLPSADDDRLTVVFDEGARQGGSIRVLTDYLAELGSKGSKMPRYRNRGGFRGGFLVGRVCHFGRGLREVQFHVANPRILIYLPQMCVMA